MKTKTEYSCTQCGAVSPKWSGKCHECGAWNSYTEVVIQKSSRLSGYAGEQVSELVSLDSVEVETIERLPTGMSELDRALGGGMVPGMVVLIGGDPGIGKSTLLLQTAARANEQALYITGEESLSQVSLRAKRLGFGDSKLQLLAETQVERMLSLAAKAKPKIMVVDSIQTLFTDTVQSAPGSVSQVRESAARLVRFAKQHHISLYLVGHVTKEGAIAGPRVLEHMVDSVLYFEGQTDSKFRLIRAVKNRFGAVNELGVFGMTDKGLKGVSNPSALFLSKDVTQTCGSTILVSWEGSRPMLLEVQALVDESSLGNPRRVSVGFDSNRLNMLLAVLNKHGNLSMHQQDVFFNVVGGVKITETGGDLAVILAVLSSFRDKIIPNKTVIFGEVGLGGEIRPVQSGLERIKEAAKHGFTRAIVPSQNAPKQAIPGLEIIAVNHLSQALEQV